MIGKASDSLPFYLSTRIFTSVEGFFLVIRFDIRFLFREMAALSHLTFMKSRFIKIIILIRYGYGMEGALKIYIIISNCKIILEFFSIKIIKSQLKSCR